MPTKKKSFRARTGASKLTEDQWSWLVDGWTLDGNPELIGNLPFTNLDAARAAWNEHREQVIALTREAEGSLSRLIPSAWWLFDAREGLRQLSGPKPLEPVKLWRGMPKMWASYEDSEAAVFETEAEYLARLNIDVATLRRLT